MDLEYLAVYPGRRIFRWGSCLGGCLQRSRIRLYRNMPRLDSTPLLGKHGLQPFLASMIAPTYICAIVGCVGDPWTCWKCLTLNCDPEIYGAGCRAPQPRKGF